jgi:hypothetical protein
VDATRKIPTPAITVVDPGSLRKENVAARYATTPTRETGATTASSLAGGSALPFISRRYQVKFVSSQVKFPTTAAIATSRETTRTAETFEFH